MLQVSSGDRISQHRQTYGPFLLPVSSQESIHAQKSSSVLDRYLESQQTCLPGIYLSKWGHCFYLEQLQRLVRLPLSGLQTLVLQCLAKCLDAELCAFTFSLLDTKGDKRYGSTKTLKVAMLAVLDFLVNRYNGGHWCTCRASKALPTRLGPMLSAGCEAGVSERLSLAGGEVKQ